VTARNQADENGSGSETAEVGKLCTIMVKKAGWEFLDGMQED